MTMRFPAIPSLALGIVCATGANAGMVVYQQDFENAANIGPEWSSRATDHGTAFTRFSERRASSTLTLTLDTMTGQAYALIFDLYIIDSWDGNGSEWGGPDQFNVRIGDTLAFSESMDNDRDSQYLTYRNPDEVGHFGFGTRPYDNDAIYRGVALEFIANGPRTSIAFFGTGLQGKNDESWGIDNLRVESVPAPAAATLFGAGAMVAARRRRTKE